MYKDEYIKQEKTSDLKNILKGMCSEDAIPELQKLEDEFYDKAEEIELDKMSDLFHEYFPKFIEILKKIFGRNEMAVSIMSKSYLVIFFNKTAGLRDIEVNKFISLLDKDLQEKYKDYTSFITKSLEK